MMRSGPVLAFVAIAGAIIVLAACAPTPAALPSPAVAAIPTPASEAKSATAGGYSIFEGTMVELPWPEIEKAAKQGAIVLLPTAVIEEHGPHMGLGIDAYESRLACQIARRNLEARGIKALIAPPLYWGINVDTGRFPGSFSLRPDTLKALLYDVLDSLRRWGLSHVFVLNTHGDPSHNQTLAGGVERARKDLGIKAYFVLTGSEAARYSVSGQDGLVIQQEAPYDGPRPTRPEVHAGAFEVGLMAKYFPSEVNLELAKSLPPTNGFEPSGYWGDPAGFNAEASQQYFEAYYQMSAEAIATQLTKE